MEEKGRKWHLRKRTQLGFILLAASIFLQMAARALPGFGQWYAVTIYPLLTEAAGRFFGFFPFSASELFLYLLLFLLVYYGIRLRRSWRRWLSGLFFLVSLLFFLYTAGCGINYYRRPFSDYLGFKAEKYAKEELEELCIWLTDQANASYTGTEEMTTADFQREGVRAMEKLGDVYPQLSGFYPKPKPLMLSRILSVQQLSGIYSPFTVEANYNKEMTAYNIPHTICHELSHLRGFMREDEANFIGFLACIDSDSPEYRSSGYMMGWIYAGNALAAVDRDAYISCWQNLRPEIQKEIRENTVFWDRFDTRVSKAAETVNNTYLKANSQTEGVRSYGRMVDLMLCWYLSED